MNAARFRADGSNMEPLRPLFAVSICRASFFNLDRFPDQKAKSRRNQLVVLTARSRRAGEPRTAKSLLKAARRDDVVD